MFSVNLKYSIWTKLVFRFAITVLCLFLFLLVGCSFNTGDNTSTNKQSQIDASIKSLDNNKVSLSTTFAKLQNAGFNYGDSVDICFKDEIKLEDVPYLSTRFYNSDGVCFTSDNNGTTLYVKGDENAALLKSNLDQTVQIKVKQSQEYAKLQTYVKTAYSDNSADFSSLEQFANFRSIAAGNLKQGAVYRGASPCNFGRRRSYVVDDLIEKSQIKSVLDLSENESDLKKDFADFPNLGKYYLNLVNNKKIIFYKLGGKESEGKNNKIIAVDIVNKLADAETPVYIHCMEGKDRTGLAGEVVGMLSGASYNEIANDYMLSYSNYFDITEKSDPSTYYAIKKNNLDSMLCNLLDLQNDTDLNKVDFKESFSKIYLNNGGTQTQLDNFNNKFLNE